MVNTAKAETAQAEKLLKEANGKIDVLQAEVKALKEVVITSTSSANLPNKHLHPYFSTSKKKENHSRQSSLNQQSLNQIAKANANSKHDELNTLSISCSNSSLNTLNSLQKSDKGDIASSRSEVNFQNSQILRKENNFKTHKRGSSYNDIQLQQPKSFIDKFFQSSSQQQQIEAKLHALELKQNDISKSQQSLQVNEPECNVEVSITIKFIFLP